MSYNVINIRRFNFNFTIYHLFRWRFDARSAMGDINADALARRFSEVEVGSGGAATWDERAM